MEEEIEDMATVTEMSEKETTDKVTKVVEAVEMTVAVMVARVVLASTSAETTSQFLATRNKSLPPRLKSRKRS